MYGCVPRPAPAAFALALLLAFAAEAAAQPVPGCAVPPESFTGEPILPRTRAALAAGGPVTIVAVGGASTQGRAAARPELAWPARLAAALGERYPSARVTVFNQAAPRQAAADMVQRFAADVLPLRPVLVVWETGTTDAVRGVDAHWFREAVQEGIDRLHAADVEVVLMDMQFSRRTSTMINLDRYRYALRAIAEANEVPLFRRYDFMRRWAEDGVFDFDVRDRDKRRQLAARLYDCIGQALALLIAEGPTAIPAPSTPPAGGGSPP